MLHRVAALALLTLVNLAHPASAQPPSYVLLAPPTAAGEAGHGHHADDRAHLHHRGLGHQSYRVPAYHYQPSWRAPYSYGWFGSPRRGHWSRSSGYYGRHLQWTFR